MNVANVLSIVRVSLTPFFLFCLYVDLTDGRRFFALSALVLLGLICLTDCLDGLAARRLGGTTPLGEVLDLGADAVFLLSSYVFLGVMGVFPYWLVAAVAVKFFDYVFTSRLLRRRGGTGIFVHDPLGRLAAFSYFAMLWAVLGERLLGLGQFYAGYSHAMFCTLVCLTAASSVHRAILLVRDRKAPAPDAQGRGRRARSAVRTAVGVKEDLSCGGR